MKREIRRKHSIKHQLVARTCIIVFAALIASFIMNVFFLEKIYVKGRTSKLMDTYKLMEKYADNIYSPLFYEELQLRCASYNISFIIADEDTNTLLSSINDPLEISEVFEAVLSRDGQDGRLRIIDEREQYTLCLLESEREDLQYLTLWGRLSNGNFYMILTSMTDIHYSVGMTNNFLLFVGIGVMVFALVMIIFITKNVSRPIEELTVISEKMADLDFDTKYEGNLNNEIDILGKNFNAMSGKLETTIGELKSANEALLKEVELKSNNEKIRTEFISNVSHELKTPIAIISGYAEGLKDGINDDPESMQYYLDVIIDESNKMNHMVKQLTELIQLEHVAYTDEEYDLFDFRQLVTNCLGTYDLIFKEKNVSVVSDICDEELMIRANEYNIEEVIRNYINNALNHIKTPNEIRITVCAKDGGAYFAVHNTGDNIPNESIEHIWDSFYKVDKARTREYGGSGIGLSIVKAIMEKHMGKYGVNNTADGVEFYAWLKGDSSCS